jgi:hypothetical protein
MQQNPERDATVGTETMSEQARPRPITARLAEEGRGAAQSRRFPALPANSAVLRVAWWAAKCRAVARGDHVEVLEGVPEEDASAIDGEEGGPCGYDGSRVPISRAAMQEATLEISAQAMLAQIEDWARGLLEDSADGT